MPPIDYDSILTATDSNIINRTELYHTGAGLPDIAVPMMERCYAARNDDWIVTVALALLCLMGVMLYNGRTILLQQLKDFFSTKRQYSEENMSSATGIYTTFFLCSVSALSMSLWYFDAQAERLQFSPVLGIPYWLFPAGYALFMAFIYIKAWLYALVNWVFFPEESNRRWMSGYFLATSLTALFLLPLSVTDLFYAETHSIVNNSYILIASAYEIMLLFKLFVNFKIKIGGILLNLLYFCSIELMPGVILWHLLSWASDNFIVKNIVY